MTSNQSGGDPAAIVLKADQSNWHPWLIASLQDTGVQTAPRRGIFLPVLGMVGIIVATTLVATVLEHAGPPSGAGPSLLLAVGWLIFSIIFIAPAYNRLLRRSWKSRARSAEEELQRSDSRRPILYLRSFKLDDQVGRPGWSERYLGTVPFKNPEQLLANLLHGYGPVIAIGRPGEQLPALGAARFYVTHARWQEKVADVVKVAQLVVWVSGITTGLRWEISHLIQSLPPEKLILWPHPHLLRLDAAEREQEWRRFREALGDVFVHPFPERLGETRFFSFSPGYIPQPVAPRGLGNPQNRALRALLKEKGFPAISLRHLFLGFRGRLARSHFLVGISPLPIAWAVWILIVASTEGELPVGGRSVYYAIVFLTAFALLVPMMALGVKRLHDRGKSGWWILWFFWGPLFAARFAFASDMWPHYYAEHFPNRPGDEGQVMGFALTAVLLVWSIVQLLFLRGTRGPNRFGPDQTGIPIAPSWR